MSAIRVYSTFKSLTDVNWAGITDGYALIRSGTTVDDSTFATLGANTFTGTQTLSGGGTISGSSGSITIAAVGTNKSITLTTTGTGQVFTTDGQKMGTTNGFITFGAGFGESQVSFFSSAPYAISNASGSTAGFGLKAPGLIGWTADSSTAGASRDLIIGRNAAATLQQGYDHATTPTAQTFKAHDVTTGTGASMTIAGGTGSTAGGAVILATSATTGAPAAWLTVKASGVINVAGIPTSSAGLVTGDLWSNSGVLTVV